MTASGTQREMSSQPETSQSYAPSTAEEGIQRFCDSEMTYPFLSINSISDQVGNQFVPFKIEESEMTDLMSYLQTTQIYQATLQNFVQSHLQDPLFWMALNKKDRDGFSSAIDTYALKSGLIPQFVEQFRQYCNQRNQPIPPLELLEESDQLELKNIARIVLRRVLASQAKERSNELTKKNDNEWSDMARGDTTDNEWVDVAKDTSTVAMLSKLSKDDLPEVKIHGGKQWGAKSAPNALQPSVPTKIKPNYFQTPRQVGLFSCKPVNPRVDSQAGRSKERQRARHPNTFGPAK